MPTPDPLFAALREPERRDLAALTTPARIQAWLDAVPYSTESRYRCPLTVVRERAGHCFDGAVLAAALLRRLGHPPRIVDLLPNRRDDDHVLALFRRDGCWGAVAKSNFSGLRYREPVYRNLRELVLSYFDDYFNAAGEKTLRGYTVPLSLAAFDGAGWVVRDATMDRIATRLGQIRQVRLLTRRQVAFLTRADGRSVRAGLLGADEAGLFKVSK